jgi:hypothetical protein
MTNVLSIYLGLLRQDSSGHLRERLDSTLRKVRKDLGPAPHDGPHDGHEPRVRLRHLHNQRRSLRSSQTGNLNIFRHHETKVKPVRSS